MTFSLPNLVTLFRIAMIPVLIVVFLVPAHWAPPASAVIFTFAGISDWLDGYLARRLSQSSPFGAFLDPIADKLMVAVALIMLLRADPRVVLAIPVVIIVGREIAISGLREWMAGIGAGKRVAVSWIAKVKTTAQIVAIVMLLYRYPVGPLPTYEVGLWLLFLAAGLTLWSMFLYLRAAWPSMRPERP